MYFEFWPQLPKQHFIPCFKVYFLSPVLKWNIHKHQHQNWISHPPHKIFLTFQPQTTLTPASQISFSWHQTRSIFKNSNQHHFLAWNSTSNPSLSFSIWVARPGVHFRILAVKKKWPPNPPGPWPSIQEFSSPGSKYGRFFKKSNQHHRESGSNICFSIWVWKKIWTTSSPHPWPRDQEFSLPGTKHGQFLKTAISTIFKHQI